MTRKTYIFFFFLVLLIHTVNATDKNFSFNEIEQTNYYSVKYFYSNLQSNVSNSTINDTEGNLYFYRIGNSQYGEAQGWFNDSGNFSVKLDTNAIDNYGVGLMYVFDEEIYVNPSTKIDYAFRHHTNPEEINFIFYDANGYNVVAVKGTGTDTNLVERKIFCSVDGATDCNKIETHSWTGNTRGDQDIETIAPFTQRYNNIKAMFILLGHNSGSKAYLNQWNLRGYWSGNNSLPDVNISGKLIHYFDSETAYIEVNFTFNVSDPENDTIYYGNQTRTYTLNKTVDYNRNTFNFLGLYTVQEEDTTPLKQAVYKDANTCRVVTEPKEANTSKINFVQGIDQYDNMRFWLNIDSQCSGSDKSFYYRINEPIRYLGYGTDIYGFTNGEQFNLTFFDGNINEKNVQIQFINTNDIVSVYNVNSTGPQFIGNVTLVNDKPFFIQVISSANESQYDLYIQNGTAITYLSNIQMFKNDSNFIQQVIGLTVDGSSDILQDNFFYGGVEQTIDFSTTVPGNFRFYEPGTYTIYLYVSDSAHIPNEFITETMTISIYEEAYDPDQDSILINNPVIYPFRQIFGGIITALGYDDNIAEIFYVAYVVVFFIMFLTIRHFEIVFIFNSMIFTVLSLILMMPVGIVLSMLVLTGLSMTPQITKFVRQVR